MVCKVGIKVKKIDVQAPLWAIPGPLLVCFILLIIVFRPSSTPLILPLVAIGGAIACHLWKWRGAACSSALLMSAMIYVLQSQASPSQSSFSRVWIIVLSLCIASAFVVTVLCSEEAYHAWDILYRDSHDHKQTLAHLNERLQMVQNKLKTEQDQLNCQIEELRQQLTTKEERQRSNEQLLKLARDEMKAVYVQQEKLVLELFQARQNSADNELKISELEELINPEIASLCSKATVKELQSQLDASIHEIQQLELQVQKTQTEQLIACQQVEQLSIQITSLEQMHKIAIETSRQEINRHHLLIEQSLNQQIEAIACEKQELEKAFFSLQEEIQSAHLQTLEKSEQMERESLIQQLQKEAILSKTTEASQDHQEKRRLEGLYQQLRDQFAEKSEILSATRRQLFFAEEKCLALQKELDETKIYGGDESSEVLYRLIATAERELTLIEQQHAMELKSLHNFIDALIDPTPKA